MSHNIEPLMQQKSVNGFPVMEKPKQITSTVFNRLVSISTKPIHWISSVLEEASAPIQIGILSVSSLMMWPNIYMALTVIIVPSILFPLAIHYINRQKQEQAEEALYCELLRLNKETEDNENKALLLLDEISETIKQAQLLQPLEQLSKLYHAQALQEKLILIKKRGVKDSLDDEQQLVITQITQLIRNLILTGQDILKKQTEHQTRLLSRHQETIDEKNAQLLAAQEMQQQLLKAQKQNEPKRKELRETIQNEILIQIRLTAKKKEETEKQEEAKNIKQTHIDSLNSNLNKLRYLYQLNKVFSMELQALENADKQLRAEFIGLYSILYKFYTILQNTKQKSEAQLPGYGYAEQTESKESEESTA